MFGFQAERLLVWIDTASPDQVSRARSGALCKEHADRLTAPRGWHLDDRRQPAPQLFRTPPASVNDATGSMRRQRPTVSTPKRVDESAPVVAEEASGAVRRPGRAGKPVAEPSEPAPSLFDLDPPGNAPVDAPVEVRADEPADTPADEPVSVPDPTPAVSHLAVQDPTSENSTMALELELPYQVVVSDSVTDSIELHIDDRYADEYLSQVDAVDDVDDVFREDDDERRRRTEWD